MNVHHLLRKPEEAHFVDEAAATTARVVDRDLVDLVLASPRRRAGSRRSGCSYDLVPWLTALIYLITLGKGMAERARQAAAAAKTETDAYIREAAGRSPAQKIADDKALLQAGTITQREFDSLKAKALS